MCLLCSWNHTYQIEPMKPYCHWFHQGKTDEYIQNPHWLLLCLTMLWCSSCYRSLVYDRKLNLWLVGRTVVDVLSNHESKVCLEYICIQHCHRVCVVLCLLYVLVLYQIANCSAYSTIGHHVVLCVDHKNAMMETGLYFKYPLTYLCAPSVSSLTWYSLSFLFCLIPLFICLCKSVHFCVPH